jgi:uncharacterized repeat protein (TIGR01451 family)
MGTLRSFSRGRSRRFWKIGATLVVASIVTVVFAAASGAMLPGSPSQFESNDGNMTLDKSGNTDWNCFAGAGNTGGFSTSVSAPAGCKVTTGAKQTTADPSGEVIWTPGQKFDTQCPTVQPGNVPNKDDFTNVASYTEMDSNNNAYFYGASIRAVANGDSSGDVEFDQQSGSGNTFGCRTAGDLLLGYDFSNGGTVLNFKALTWIDSTNSTAGGNNGTCFVKTDSMPCWGANVLQPASSSAEGLANQAAILASDNGISGTALAAQQFAEFGVDLTTALGLNASCLSFPQLVWESRSSGSSFTSNPEDIEFQHETINTCAQPTITTQATPTTNLVLGQLATIGDTATLHDGNSPSGNVTFTLYSDPTCTKPVANISGTGQISNSQASYSTSWTPAVAGTYYWIASYLGDNKNLGFTTSCGDANEELTVAPNSPSIVTNASTQGGNVVGTGTTCDSATLSGSFNGTGTITFTLTAPDSTSTQVGSPVTVHGDGTYQSPSCPTMNQVGTYTWSASYTGDDNNNPAQDNGQNESVTSVKASPSIVTNASTQGGNVVGTGTTCDSATLSGSFNGTGTITFTLTAPDSTSTQVGSPVTVHGDGTYQSPSCPTMNQVGTYTWSASYTGDDNNNPAQDNGQNESVTSVKASPSIVTQQDPASGSVGDTYKDSASLSGTFDGSGSITWTLYPNSDCSGTPLGTDTESVDGDGKYETPTGVTVNSAGTYYWVAQYSGDANNGQATSGCAAEPVQVNGAAIHIKKTADHTQVSAGDQIGFTMTVWNDGNGDAHGVKLADPLPTNPGLNWQIASQGSGWAGTCKINSGELDCGPVTVPTGTTQSNSTFTVHITSPTTGATGGICPGGSGVVNNIGNVTTSNDGSDQSTATTCVQALVDLAITKSGSPETQDLGQGNITWTMVVTNNGPSTDTGVKVSDPMPAGNTYVSSSTTQGTCTGGAILNCDLGTMAAGASVTITLVTTPSTTGIQTNTATVSGDLPETNLTNNVANASVEVTKPFVPPCVLVSSIRPGQLVVGRKTTLTIHLTQNHKAAPGFKVRIQGAGINVVTEKSNAKGIIKHALKMKRKGILRFSAIGGPNGNSCGAVRIGVRGPFTPPVTG